MSPDLINMAHIKVAGLGGLGMLATVVVTVMSLPQIGIALIAGVGFGAAIAAGLVAYRCRPGAAGGGADAGWPPSVLSLDDRAASTGRLTKRGVPRVSVAATV